MADKLTPRQQLFIAHYLKGAPATAAAREAGFSEAYAHKAPRVLLAKPLIKAAIDAAQGELRAKASFEVEDALREADEMIGFAKQHKNAMAAAKLLELKMKLFGLLVEKLDVRQTLVDLGGAMLEARTRALRTIDGSCYQVPIASAANALLPAVNPFD